MGKHYKIIDRHNNNMERVPICDKYLLTVNEAASYFGIGRSKLREMTEDENCPFVLWNGNRRMIKRREFEEYLHIQISI